MVSIIQNYLAETLSKEKYEHSLAVAREAVRLAQYWHGDSEKAYLAGLSHDIAREIPGEELIVMAQDFGLTPHPIELMVSELLHGPVATEILKRQFGVQDEDVLQAISIHTYGSVNMTLLQKIIYLADVTEPNRSFPGIQRIRQLAEEDLDMALIAAFNSSISYVIQKGWLLHPDTIDARNALIIKSKP